MEHISPSTVGRPVLSDSVSAGNIHSIPPHTPTSQIRRRRSVFSLATDIFKQRKAENEGNDENSHDKERSPSPTKDSWNPFMSLRGLRDNKKKTTPFSTQRGSSRSTGKHDPLSMVRSL